MCHRRHRLRIFLFCRKVVFRFQDIHVFILLTIPWFTKYVTSWWVLVHGSGCIFEYISITNYVKIPVFHLFEKVNKGHVKVTKYSILDVAAVLDPPLMSTINNRQISLWCHFKKIIKGSETIYHLQSQKQVRNVCQKCLTKFHFDSA